MFKFFKKCLCLDCKNEARDIEEITCDCVLRSIFEEKCSFSLTRKEVQDIQNAVEIMVFFLLTSIYEHTRFRDLVCSDKNVIKTLTSIKYPHRIHEELRKENLLKVGSYYENTKNCYPDEFDYICVIADCDVEDYIAMKSITSSISDIFHETLHNAIQNGFKFPVGSCLEFDKYVRLHGPAASLKFKYKCGNGSSNCRSIFVDLTPACKVSIRNILPKEIRIQYSEWRDIILETGSFLIIKFFNSGHPKNKTKTKISITESEKLFMQTKISEDHKRVFRLLKFIFNGNMPVEDLKKHIRDQENRLDIVCCQLIHPRIVYDISSYVIKTLMFHHCHSCERTAEATDRDCIVATLNCLKELFKKEQRKFRKEEKNGFNEDLMSVTVTTMTGDYIEIADCYRSTKKIVRVLKNFVQAITDTKQNESLPQRITDRIPLAIQMQSIGLRDTQKHTSRKAVIPKQTICVLIFAIALIITSGYFIAKFVNDLKENLKHESENCFLGQGAVDGIIFDGLQNLTLNFSKPRAVISQNTSKYFLCLDQPFASGEKVAPKRWLHFCGYERNCTGDRCYRLQTDIDGPVQEALCDSYTFPHDENDVMHSTENTTSVDYSERRVVCVWKFSPCLVEFKRNPLGELLRSDTTCFDKEGSHYLHSVIQERGIVDCNANKFENNGSICCCGSYPCSYQDRETHNIQAYIVMSAIVGWLPLCSVTICCCSGIRSCMKYRRRKRRLLNGNIL